MLLQNYRRGPRCTESAAFRHTALSLKKYLKHYCEPEAQKFSDFPRQYQHVLVVPSHDEPINSVLKLLNFQESKGAVLVILIINSPDSLSGTGNDSLLWNDLQAAYPVIWSADKQTQLYALPHTDNALLVIDRFSENRQIPQHQGVGLARKIGADIAYRLIHDGKITSRWIHSTDADVELPKGYFQSSQTHPDSCALIYPFQHRCSDPTIQPLIDLYEFKLRYYVAALQWCGSHYGFHTIGSLMCVDANSYAEVRGFPKRNAAEDFYLLNKLAKVGSIHTLKEPTVRIEARLSARVPFGTGPALNNIRSLGQPQEQYLFYHPCTFMDLARWQNLVVPLWHARAYYQQHGLQATFRMLIEKLDDDAGGNAEVESFPHDFAAHQSERLAVVLTSLKLDTFLTHGFKQCSTQLAFQKQASYWFDGFKTLRFIHQMRDHYFENIRLRDLTGSYAGWLDEISKSTDQSEFTLNRATELQNAN